MQQPHLQNQQLPLNHTQRALTQNTMHTHLTADQNWLIPNQQTLQYKHRCNWDANVTIEPVRQKALNKHKLQLHISNRHRNYKIQQMDIDSQ